MRYMVQTRDLDPHVQPGKQRPLPSLPIHSIDKGPPIHILFLSPELVKVELD